MTPRKNMQARCSIDSLSSPIVPFHRPGCHDHDVRAPYRFRFPTERPLSPLAGDPSVGDAPSWNGMQTCMPHFLDKVAAFLGKEANALLTLNKTSSGFI